MGVLWRKRSLLLKLLVVFGTAWFTVAFLMFSDSGGSQNRLDLGEGANIPRHRPGNNIVAERQIPDRVVPFKDATTIKKEDSDVVERKQNDDNVLIPPQSLAGEMGKPVVLPTNLSGKCDHIIGSCCLGYQFYAGNMHIL